MLVAPHDPALGPARLEVAHPDAHRHAGTAAVAQGLVDEVVRASEAGVGQRVVLGDRVRTAQLGDELGLQPVRQIRTAHRRRGAEESQGLDVLADEHGSRASVASAATKESAVLRQRSIRPRVRILAAAGHAAERHEGKPHQLGQQPDQQAPRRAASRHKNVIGWAIARTSPPITRTSSVERGGDVAERLGRGVDQRARAGLGDVACRPPGCRPAGRRWSATSGLSRRPRR